MATVLFDEDDAGRILSAIQRVEAWPVNDAPSPAKGAPSGSSQMCRAQVTSGTPTSGRYPCTFQTYDPDTKAWTGLGTGWAVGPNGETLTNNNYYLGLLSGVLQSDSNPVVMVIVGSSSASIAGAWGYTGSSVNVSANTWAILGWGTTGSSPAWSYANGLFTVPNGQAGTYECIGSIYWNTTDLNSDYTCDFGKNGAPAATVWDRGGTCSQGSIRCIAQQIFALAVGDTIGLYANSDFTGTSVANGIAISIKKVPGG